MDDRGSIPCGGRDFFLFITTSKPALEPHPASCVMATGDYFPRVKAAGS
jgi:hypothetical protein